MATHMVLTATHFSTDKHYIIQNLDNLSIDHNSPVSPMPLPEDNAEQNILVKIEGNSMIINVSWTVVDGATNFVYYGAKTHNGSVWNFGTADTQFTSPTNTLRHINYLIDIFNPISIQDGFEFSIYNDDAAGEVFNYGGNISSMQFSVSGDSPINYTARMQFLVGDVVSLFEEDIPEQPQLVSVTAGNDSFTAEWKEWDGYSSGEEPTLTGVRIAYKKSAGGQWEYKDLTSSSSFASGGVDNGSYTVTGLSNTTSYKVKIGHKNANTSTRYHYSTKQEVTTT
jgi:hypothetical protein